MTFERRYSVAGRPARDQVEWKIFRARITGADGAVIFDQEVEAPATWSQTAVNILAQKYLRKSGVPQATVPVPATYGTTLDWLRSSAPVPGAALGGETSAHQAFHRLAGAWTYWGRISGMLDDYYQARVFYDELYVMMARQVAAPNSPQWFNTGLHWAYGIEGGDSGLWRVPDGCDGATAVMVPHSYVNPQVMACFIQPVRDTLVGDGGIMDLWTREARLFKHGSGSGSNVSAIRARGEPLSGGGVSSGLMSFLRVGDRAAGAIKSGGTTRRAALMRVLDLDHPEIEDFVDWKVREEAKAAALAVGSRALRDPLACGVPEAMLDRARAGIVPDELSLDWEGEAVDTVSGQNSNNSVRVTDAFLRAVDADGTWDLTRRTDGVVAKTIRARDLWNRICRAAWACADPGVQFDDAINRWNTCPGDDRIRASNPCSEFVFLDNTSCNLASLRLTAFLRDNGTVDTDALVHAARMWTCVLDVSVTMASFPSREIAEATYNYRSLGLGYADLGGLLMRAGIPYDSDEGRDVAASLTSLMCATAWRTSAELAGCLGSFPRYEDNCNSVLQVAHGHAAVAGPTRDKWDEVLALAERHGVRNAQLTLLAPTGTIGLVMDCDTLGVEPEFSLVKIKNLAGGGVIRIVNKSVDAALGRLGYDNPTIMKIEKYIAEHGTLEGCQDLKTEHLSVFDCAVPAPGSERFISAEAHVRMVAAVQPFLCGAVSKTINMPRSATIGDVDMIYREAHRLGLKAVALYRDGSKLTQPLAASGASVRGAENTATAVPRGRREYLPWRRTGGFVQKVKINNQSIFLRVSEYPDGRPAEVFITLAHEGSTLRAMADMLAMAVSVGLQHGVPVGEFIERFHHTRFEPAGFVEGHDEIKVATSIGDYIARELEYTYAPSEIKKTRPLGADSSTAPAAPITGDVCPECGSASVERAGACLVCTICGASTGCG